MNLYFIEQSVNTDYDTYSDAVVAAADEEAARNTHPDGRENWDGKTEKYGTWCEKASVRVELIGIAVEGTTAGVVCASFHAG